tara:strand:- start:8384 stop:8869 length:486 start_codon:yes stop_codon:yes gene_type:complete
MTINIMNITKVFLIFVLSFTNATNGFPHKNLCKRLRVQHIRARFPPSKLCKRVRVNYKLFVKQNKNELVTTRDTAINSFTSIVKDDISNDLLYMLKYYHLTNNDKNDYLYIIFYELISLSISKEKDKSKLLAISLSNIILYILIKNIILNKFIHHLIVLHN